MPYPAPSAARDDLIRATRAWLASPHDERDEDLHPARLDPAEAELERALARLDERGARPTTRP